MRIGFNPNKDKVKYDDDLYHQVVIPVYIPNEKDYFKDSLAILKKCLLSLFKTSHSKTYFTVINNGSCQNVINYLDELLNEKRINELIHSPNIGKLNSILKGVVGHNFKFITITDADVLFLDNWQKASYEVFTNFKKTGAVCTTPSSKSFNYKTFNIILENLFSKKMKFTKVKDPIALNNFALSVNNPEFYNSCHLEKYLTISNGDFKAVVGAGHFVTTYRADVFHTLESVYTSYSLGGNSESNILDLPVVKKGLWRLSTEGNYTCHMGNVLEPWMEEIFKKQVTNNDSSIDFNFIFEKSNENIVLYWFKNVFFSRVFQQKKIKRLFLKYKGLSSFDASNY